MDNKQDIGKAFKEKLNNLKASPQDFVWDNIVAELDKKNKKRSIIPFWFKGVAAALIIGGIIWLSVINTNDKKNIEIVSAKHGSDKKEKVLTNSKTMGNTGKLFNDDEVASISDKSKKITSNDEIKDSINSKNNTISNFKNNKTTNDSGVVANNKGKDNENFNKKAIQIISDRLTTSNSNENNKDKKQKTNSVIKLQNTNNNLVYLNTKGEKINQNSQKKILQNVVNANRTETKNLRPKENAIYAKLSLENKNYLYFIFADLPKSSDKIDINEALVNSDKEIIVKKWNLSVKGSPIYYGSVSNSLSTDQDMGYNNKTSETTMSYGLQTSLALTSKINLRTGISKVDFAYNTKGIFNENVLTPQTVVSNSFFSSGIDAFTSNNEEVLKLTQNISYIEIPTEISYKLIDKKLSVNFITGVSTLILQNNNIFINDDILLGSVNNLNKTSFTGNLGLGFDYKITKRINISVEPIFKLQFKAYNDNTNNKPYYFGAYSGFVYKF